MTETRYVDLKTGGMKGQKPARFGGADPLFLMELAKVYGMGEEKYERYNYLKGYPWSLSIDALFRHLLAFLAGEDVDPESGLLHTAHVAWHAGALTSFQLRNVGTDDRAPAQPARGDPMFDMAWNTGCACEGCEALQPAIPHAWPSCDHKVPLVSFCWSCFYAAGKP